VMSLSSTISGLSASFALSLYAATMGIKPSLTSSNDYVATCNFSFDRSANHSRGKPSKRYSGQLRWVHESCALQVTRSYEN
jgi:hypothetical protein